MSLRKLLFTCTFFILSLSACFPVVDRPMPLPVVAVPPSAPSIAPEVKIVNLVTQTPVSVEQTPESVSATMSTALATPTTTGTAPALPAKTLADLGFKVATYQDTQAGFTFDYPANWLLTPISDADKANARIYSASLRSYEKQALPKQQDGIPPDMAAIDVTVTKDGPKTLEQAINERRSAATQSESGQPIQIVSEEDWVLRGGLKAHRLLYNLGKDLTAGSDSSDRLSSEMITIVNGHMILVSGFGDQSLFDVIASTLLEIKK